MEKKSKTTKEGKIGPASKPMSFAPLSVEQVVRTLIQTKPISNEDLEKWVRIEAEKKSGKK